jgi:hypothetical protein
VERQIFVDVSQPFQQEITHAESKECEMAGPGGARMETNSSLLVISSPPVPLRCVYTVWWSDSYWVSAQNLDAANSEKTINRKCVRYSLRLNCEERSHEEVCVCPIRNHCLHGRNSLASMEKQVNHDQYSSSHGVRISSQGNRTLRPLDSHWERDTPHSRTTHHRNAELQYTVLLPHCTCPNRPPDIRNQRLGIRHYTFS